MATDSAPVLDTPAHKPTPAPRQYWQLPVFALGLAAAIVSWKAFPLQPLSASEKRAQAVRALETALDRKMNWHEVDSLLSGVSAEPTETDSRTLFLLGSAHTLLAEQGPAELASQHWTRANELFTRVDLAAIDSALNQARYRFRSAKAAAAMGVGEPAALLAALETVPPGEEAGDRSRLIADTCLRSVPPDYKRAKLELSAFLAGPHRGTPESQARYKLKLSELHLSSHEPDKARKWLREIGTSAPASVRAEAACQLAALSYADRDYSEGVKVLQAIERSADVPGEQLTRVRYELGRGQIAMGNIEAGRSTLAKAATDDSPVGMAAAVRLAEQLIREQSLRSAAELLESVGPRVKSPEQFRNTLVSLTEVRTAFESAVFLCQTAGEFDAAMRTATAYRTVAPNGKDRELVAEIRAAWGERLLTLSSQSVEGKGKLTQAAAEFQQLADERTPSAEKARWLNRALQCSQKAGDTAGVREVIAKLDSLPDVPDDVKIGLKLAQAEQLLKDNQFREATTLLTAASRLGGTGGARATVKLALAHVNEGMRLVAVKSTEDEGKKMIQLGQELLTQVANKTPESPDARPVHEESLFELGRLNIHPSLPSLLNYPEAEMRFRRLLQEYPTGQFSERSSLYLGISLTQLALGANKNGTLPPDADRKLTEALKLFEGLSKAADPWVRTHADMRVVHTLLLTRQYDTLPQVCADLAEKYRGQVHELIVLNMLYTGYKQAKRPDLATGVYDRMEKAFTQLPDTSFGNEMPEYRKSYWVDWFAREKR